MDRKNLLKGNDFFGNLKNSGILALVVIGVVLMFLMSSLMFLASGLNRILNFNKNNINLLKNFKIYKMIGYRTSLKLGGIFALIVGLIFIFSAVNVSAGGCCCYAGSCLNEINDTANVSAANAYLKVDKFVDKDIVQVGDTVGYTIIVRNLGNTTAYDVTVNDTLPIDISSVTLGDINYIYNINGNGGIPTCQFLSTTNNESGKVLYCKINKIPKKDETGANVTIFFGAKVTQHTNAPINHTNNVSVNGFYTPCLDTNGDIFREDGNCPCTNLTNCNQVYGVSDIATVQRDQYGSNGYNDLRDNATVWIVGIDVTKYATTNSTLQAGDEVVFHITITNTGDLQVCNITVHDRLPSALEFVDSSPENSSPVTERDVYFNLGCLNGSLSTTINITTKVSTAATTLSSLSNFVEVNGTVYNASGNATDINVTDNYTTPPQYFDNETGTNQTPQIGKATLSLNKIAMDPWTRPNREIKYRVEVDTGGAMVYGAQITDHLPGAFQYMNNIIQLNDGECTPNSTTSSNSTGEVIFNLGNFTGKCIFEYTVYVPWNTKDGYYRNNQTLTANDKNNQTLANVTDNAPVIVDGNTRLTVNKDVVNPRIFQPNDIIEYTLTVSNEGDNEIHDVNVTDLIPYGMNYSSSWLEGGNVYIPGYDEAAIGSPACQITSQTCNTTHCNVTVGCCNNEIYTYNDIPNGTSQTGSASCTNYNVSCNNSNPPSCTISYSNNSTVQIIGDLKYTDPSKGYKAIWHFDIIGAKTTKVIHLNLTITSDSVGGSSMNKVEVTGITPNGDVLLWKDIASSARIGKANLLIEKSSDTATIAAGEEVTYTIRVKNIGEGYAQNITIKDEPGSQMQLGAISMASCNGGSLLSEKYEGGPATNYGDSVTYILKNVSLAPGKECVINYKAYTASTSQEGLYVNKATLNWRDMFGTEQMALSTTAAVMILPPDALMSIRKQSNATCAQPGEKLNYTITIENKGNETLRDVIINDTLPDGFKNLSQAYWGNFNCSNMPNGTCVRDINSDKSNYTGEGIGGFTTVTLSIEAIVTSNTTEGLNTNKVTITAKRPSGTPVKGSSSHILQVNKPHISITKWASTTMREPGQNVTFYIEVKNTGAGDAKNITITDDATPFEHIGNVSVVSGDCTVNKSEDGNIATFWINDNGTFNAYKTCIFKYLMKVPANTTDGTYTNNASLSYQDLNNTEFSKSAGTDVLVTINLFPDVEKIANDTSLQPGDRVNFTINVRNYGSATMTNGTVTDTLPPGFRCLKASGITNGINCSCVNDTTAICNLIDLVGNTISNPLSMWVEAKVNGSATEGSNENNVSLNGTRPDGLPINRTTEAKVFVNEPKPQLEIYKWTDTIKATPNSTVIYYILVKNTGDGDVYNLTINDTMDFGSITSYSTIPNGCADCNTSTKSCNISHLSSAGQCQIKLIALINENATDGTHNNTVNVSGFMKGGTEINKTKLNDTESINVEADVKLTVTKKANTTEVNAGDNVTYTVIVRNDGVNRVMVNVTDNAPLGFTCVNKTPNESVWINGNSLETFTFECNVNSSATQGNNTVVVNGVAENNQTFDANGTTTIVLNTPKLEIIKEAVTGTVEQNGIATYKIIVRNTGTAPVKNISITDRGDGGGGTFTTAALGGPSLDTAASTGCTGVNSGELYCSDSSPHYHEVNFTTNGTMNPGQQCVFTYTLTVKSTAEIGNYANNATITGAYHPVDNSSYTPTPEPKDNATIRVIPQMNVSFTKTGNATAEPGQSVTFTINITNNNAGADMTDVVFNDTLPDGFNCTSNSTQRIPENTELNIGCSCDGRQINCNIGTIKNSSTVIINITADVNSSAELSSTNRANVTYNVTNTTLITSEASHTVTILKPQLSVLKENNATGVIRPGQDVNYTITVKNTGGGTAYNISIRDVLDDGLTHTSVSNISCNGLTNSSTGTNAIDFNISSLANNSNCKFNITVHVPEQVNNSVFGNTINITDAQFGDGTHLNSTYGIGENATSDITVQAFTNVSVVKSANPTSAQPGDSINFTINVTNNGGNTVYNIKVDDILPYGFNPNCTTLSPGNYCNCNESTRKINCTFPNSTVLSVISAKVTVNSSANPLSTNTANVSYDLPNGTTQQTDNPGQTTVTVNKPNLTIQKTPNNPKASRDQNISFEIRIKNIGTGTAHNILIQDVLPSANMQHISNGTNVSGCSQSIIIANPLNTNTTTFTLDNLTAGQECIFNYTVYIDENISDGNYTNIATITGGKFGDDSYMDSSYGNNSNSNATVEVTTTIIPSIEKIPSNDKMQPGDTINFTIIIKNNGNNDWKNVAVKDVLPAGFIYNNTINVTPSTGGYTNITYNSTTRELNYTGVTVPKFGNWTVIVVANVTSGASSPSTNRVNASSPDNRSVATVATVVVDKPALIVSKEPLLLTYLPGDNATYRIKITNTGTGDAFNVTMEDAFADLKFYHNGNESISIAHCGTNNNTNVSITSGNGTNSAIFALNDTLAGQENCEFTYTVRVDERHEDGLYANNAKVNSTMGDGTKLPVAEDSAQVLIKADVSMRVTKTSNATDQKVNAGDYINFTITVYENGNSPIYDVNVSDTVPYGCVVTNVTNNSNVNGSWDGRNVNFIIGKINNRSHVDLNITCYINHSMTKGWNTNSVRVVAKKPNGDEIYGSASTQIRMLLPDISWTKESLNKTILAGQKVTYKIKVTNKGDGTAHNLTIVDYLPKGDEGNWTYASGTNINDSCGYNWNATNVSNDGNIVKFFLDKMNGSENPAGTECAFTFEVQIPHGTTSVMYANTIGGNWSYGDINNNTPKATNYISNQTPGESNVYVYAGGGIIIQKESDKEVYQYGDIIDYTITVYSNGIPTTNLTVTDVIPKGLRLIECPGSAKTEPSASSPTIPSIDFASKSNSSNYSITNTLIAKLSAVNNDTDIQENDTVLWTANITNDAVSNATMTNVTLVYSFGNDLNVTMNTTSKGTCTRNNDTQVTCNIGDIALGTIVQVNITTNATGNTSVNGTPTVTYNATAAGKTNTSCPSMSGNYDVSNCSITSTGTVILTKTANVSYVQPGESINYTITINNTNADVNMTNIIIGDILPPGFTCNNVTGYSGCDCDNITNSNCNLGNGNKTINIIATVNSSANNNTAYNNAAITYNITSLPTTQEGQNITVSQHTTVFKPDLGVWKNNNMTNITGNNVANDDMNVTYTIVVVNNGGGDAKNVTVEDVLQSPLYHITGVESVECTGNTTSVTVTNTSVGTNEMNFTFNSIENGTKCKITYKVNVPRFTNTLTYTNNVTIVNGTFANDEPLTADEGINKTDTSNLIVAGKYVHICQFTYSQGPNNQSVFHIKAKVTEDISDQQITNTVRVNGTLNKGTSGEIPLYAESTKSVNLENPNVSIVKWADTADIEPGQEVTFYVQIQNPSETNLINLSIKDILPKGFEYVHNSSKLEGQLFNESNSAIFNVTPEIYNESNNNTQQNITWNVSNLLPKTIKLLTFKAKVKCNITEGEKNTNNVCINGTTHDDERVGACTNYTMTGHLAHLTINKYADKDKVKWFDVVEYTIAIKNPALGSAHSILKEINDTMAKNLKYINNSATINGEVIEPQIIGNYTDGTTLIWNGSKINDTAVWVGTKVVLKYRVLIMPGLNGILDNNVSLEYYDPLPGHFDPEAVFKASFRSAIVRDGYAPKQNIVSSGNVNLFLGDEINTPVTTTTTIHLKQGWNLISLPIQPEDTNIDMVLNSIKGKYTDVFAYEDRWVYKSEYMNKWFGDLSKLEAGKGYWIKVNEDCSLTINGIIAKSANISLKQGWNLVGPLATTGKSISLDNLNVQYTDIFTYEDKWVYKSEYMNKWFGDLNKLEAGKGYWIKVENNEEQLVM